MNTKTVGVIIAFAAVTAVLNLIRIPAPYLITHSYQLGDISIVTAFLLFGYKSGIMVAILNMLITTMLNINPAGVLGATYYFISVLTMLLGMYIFEKFLRQKLQRFKIIKPAIAYTTSGLISRSLIMLAFDYSIFGFLVALVSGNSIDYCYGLVIAVMPAIVVYNITTALIMIPIGYYIADIVSKKLPLHFKIN